MMAYLALFLQLWTSMPRQPPVLLEGNWESCDGGEKVYDYCVNGACLWSFHMGPDDQFGLFRYPAEDESNSSESNLLKPDYRVSDPITWRADRVWTLPDLKLFVKIVLAGGSRTNCFSYYVIIRELVESKGLSK